MLVREIMTSPVDSIQPENSIASAAREMAENDVGALPVTQDGRLVGMVTDRDIAVRSVALGLQPTSPVSEIMTSGVISCSQDDLLEEILEIMADEKVRRLPVCDDRDQVVGIVSMADAALFDRHPSEVAEALADICQPSGRHSQSLSTVELRAATFRQEELQS